MSSLSPKSTTPTGNRRPSAVYNSLQDMLNAGGQNSISKFASSYSRSANFINADFDVAAERPKTLEIGTAYSEESPLLNDNTHNEGLSAVSSNDQESANDVLSVRSIVLKHSGNSTAPQTIFNGINTLIGIGILSLPLALDHSGWVFGTIILTLCALCTQYTAKILAKCMQVDENLKTYGDIAFYSFGKIAYFIVVSTFTIDLVSAGTSMVIIFADSFNALTGIDKFVFKCIISFLFFLSSFLELSILSSFSLVGIICTTCIMSIVVFCGFNKTEAPGSLIEVSPTSLWPKDLLSLAFSIGIFMSPFGGHAIFPELVRDMRHPYKYNSCCTTIFSVSWLVDYIMASLGYLMFGSNISDQITKSIMIEKGFPAWVKIFLVVFMGVLPVCKGPLILRPIITLFDQFTLHKIPHVATKSSKLNMLIVFLNRLAVTLICFITALVFTDFGKIISFLGSAICLAICVIFPLSFYLKLYYAELSSFSKTVCFICIFISTVLAISGTVAVAIIN